MSWTPTTCFVESPFEHAPRFGSRVGSHPESVRYRKAGGQPAQLCFGGHVLMENRNGLGADFTRHIPITEPEPVVALHQADSHAKLYGAVIVKTLGADKAYHQRGFVQGCRKRAIAPYVACKHYVNVADLDGRTTTQPG